MGSSKKNNGNQIHEAAAHANCPASFLQDKMLPNFTWQGLCRRELKANYWHLVWGNLKIHNVNSFFGASSIDVFSKHAHRTARQHTPRFHPLTMKIDCGFTASLRTTPSKSGEGSISQSLRIHVHTTFSTPGRSALVVIPFKQISWARACWISLGPIQSECGLVFGE